MYKEFDDCEVFIVIETWGAVLLLNILNNLQESPFINDLVYSKVLYKKTLAITLIASDIGEYLILNTQKK